VGVTFAGRAVPWPSIDTAKLMPRGPRAYVLIAATSGPMMLGPGPTDRMVNLERLIRAKVRASRAGKPEDIGDPSLRSG
jgi:hypothetical protein